GAAGTVDDGGRAGAEETKAPRQRGGPLPGRLRVWATWRAGDEEQTPAGAVPATAGPTESWRRTPGCAPQQSRASPAGTARREPRARSAGRRRRSQRPSPPGALSFVFRRRFFVQSHPPLALGLERAGELGVCFLDLLPAGGVP